MPKEMTMSFMMTDHTGMVTMMGLRLPMMVTDMNILPTKMVMMDIITTPIQMNMALEDNIVVRILDIDDTKDDGHNYLTDHLFWNMDD